MRLTQPSSVSRLSRQYGILKSLVKLYFIEMLCSYTTSGHDSLHLIHIYSDCCTYIISLNFIGKYVYSELLGLKNLFIVRNSENIKTQRFANWICSRPRRKERRNLRYQLPLRSPAEWVSPSLL
jgi:hypothetical protein